MGSKVVKYVVLTWMTHSTAQVDKSSFSQQDNVLAVLQGESVDLKQKDKIYVIPKSKRGM